MARQDRKRNKGRNGLTYFIGKDGKVWWRATANGHTVAGSTQGYDSRRDAVTGVRSAAVQLAKAILGIRLPE